MSLVFYATEASGEEVFFDQILHFAAIQTDTELNEIGRFQTQSRLLPHVVPAPGAMRMAKKRLSRVTNSSCQSHYEMVRALCGQLDTWSPALFMGWNSLEIDENLIRQALYKTLHNPYFTNRDGNSRSDVMRIIQACSIHAPDALVFPTGDDGRLTFELRNVAFANGFNREVLCEAIDRVEATIFLCRLLIERVPHLWSTFMRFSTKSAVTDYLAQESIVCVSDFFFGKPYSWIVTPLGQNQSNKAEWYVYNLDINPDSLLRLNNQQLATRLLLF